MATKAVFKGKETKAEEAAEIKSMPCKGAHKMKCGGKVKMAKGGSVCRGGSAATRGTKFSGVK